MQSQQCNRITEQLPWWMQLLAHKAAGAANIQLLCICCSHTKEHAALLRCLLLRMLLLSLLLLSCNFRVLLLTMPSSSSCGLRVKTLVISSNVRVRPCSAAQHMSAVEQQL
jgi:hypothetical protein